MPRDDGHGNAGLLALRHRADMGRAFPVSYFVPISVGTFTKGLGFEDLAGSLAALAVFVPVLTFISLMLLRKHER